jgi:hypothetical protein
MLSSTNLVRRLLYASRHHPQKWPLKLLEGRRTLLDTADFEVAVDRILGGELPPLLPSEQKENSKRRVQKRINPLRASPLKLKWTNSGHF